MSTNDSAGRTLKVLLYSDDRSTRDDVRLALGRRIAADLPEVEIFETATGPAAVKAVEASQFDVLVLDAEAVPFGGMGLARQLKDELSDCPAILLLVARAADAWLGTWSKADAIEPYPIDPIRLPAAVADLARRRLGTTAP